jgi:peptidyl-prolyl cis-trans isomerase SurA
MSYKNSMLEEENVDFKMLMKEYHDGILLFSISDEEVWGKAVRDTSGLKEFYEKNKENYKWKERTDAVIYKCSSDSIAKQLVVWLNDSLSLDTIIKMANKKSSLNLHFERGKYETGVNDIIDQINRKTGISNIINQGSTFYVVDVKELIPVKVKTIDEARGLITADYQNYLESKWIKKLKNDHKVIINEELLNTL